MHQSFGANEATILAACHKELAAKRWVREDPAMTPVG